MPFTNFKTTCQLLLLCLCNSYLIWIEFFAFITCNDINKLNYPAYCFLQHSIIFFSLDRMLFPGGIVIGAENQTAAFVTNTTPIDMYNNTQHAQSTNSLPTVTDWGLIHLITASVIPLILTLIIVPMCIYMYYRCKRKTWTAG